MYTGMFMPNGQVPLITMDKTRARDFDCFVSNYDTYLMYFWRLMDIAMSVFAWDNLPKGVDERMMEFWLLRDGFVGFFYEESLIGSKDAPEGYAVLPLMLQGNFDMYNYPKDRRAYAINGMNYELNEDNSVIIYNDYLRTPTWFTIEQYAKRLALAERTIDVNIAAQKTPKVIRCNDKQRLTMLNLSKEVDEGKPWIFGDKNLDLNDVEVFDTSSPFVALDLQIYLHQKWNEALTYLGVQNVNTEKKERLISDEVMNNMGDVEAQRFVRLNARKQAVEEINELFGLDITCDFRTGMYIKADGFAARNLPTMGMESATLLQADEMANTNVGGTF